MATALLSKEERNYPGELVQIAKKARTTLYESSKRFGEDTALVNHNVSPVNHEPVSNTDEALMREQLNFINKLSADIDKTTKALTD